jgi:hypothetical protein
VRVGELIHRITTMLPANDNRGEGVPLAHILERVNGVRVTAELLGAALHAQTGMQPQGRSAGEAAMLRILQLLMNKGYRSGQLWMTATAIEFRLTALANLMANDGFLPCSVPRDAAYPAVITLEMLQAGADEPLIEDADGQAAFHSESFLRRVLTNTGSSGHA